MDKPTGLWPLGPSVAMVLHLRGASLALELSNLLQITPYPLVPSFTSHSLPVWAPLLLMSLHISKEHTPHSLRMRLFFSWALRQSHPTFESSRDYLISCCSNSEGERPPLLLTFSVDCLPYFASIPHQAHALIPMTILKPELPQPSWHCMEMSFLPDSRPHSWSWCQLYIRPSMCVEYTELSTPGGTVLEVQLQIPFRAGTWSPTFTLRNTESLKCREVDS